MKKLPTSCIPHPAFLFLLLSISTFSQSLTSYVNPFIGTREMGHTFPGACLPFGFVQLSPDTDTIPYDMDGKYNPPVYRYCAGYQYDDKTIVGFSHTHFNGTGHSDLGDFLIMPTAGPLQLNPGTAAHPEQGYRSAFRHETEKAEPGYYKVHLDDPDVDAELTTTLRCGFHRYTFPKADSARIILDLIHGIYNYDGKVLWAYVRVVNDTLITGYRITSGWGRNRYMYFALAFSKPFDVYGWRNADKPVYRGFWRRFSQYSNFPEMAGKKIRAWFGFSTFKGEQVKLKIGLSAVSMEGAIANLQAEIPGWDFDKIRSEAHENWEKELSRIKIEMPGSRVKGHGSRDTSFYTAFYHVLMNPVVYQDVDGKYRGIDQEIHQAVGFVNYTTFSLWDTYRALHPLLTWLYPQRSGDMVSSMLAHYDQSAEKMLPVWSFHGNEDWCMTGYHSVSVIADAWVKGVRNFDPEQALRACVATSANKYYEGITDYMKLGFVPLERSASAASVTLEYAYDDYAISRFAEAVAEDSASGTLLQMLAGAETSKYLKRSENYKNVLDRRTGFMRPKNADGTFKPAFDPLSTSNQGFIEGNSWNYSFHVPQDIPGLITLMGGDKVFVSRLDSLFTMHLDDKYFAETEDVTRDGLIGNYVHGNEPSHHIPYLYNWTSQPWKTQAMIHKIINSMYKNAVDGLCGNDDCGQMSAWYIFSTLGFYPVCPGTDEYSIGSPCVSKATVSLPNGKTLTIIAKNLSENNIYIKSVTLRGKSLIGLVIHHKDLMEGGLLLFGMSDRH
ncbi:MAG: GH92 family glycosyl hydrolase [Bacteroidetes bacterium]|nr:GH92 family glycosyl hydrolase [Bacteroidota bacterium]